MNLFLDFVLIASSIWMIGAVKSFGGILGKAFDIITWGAVILGLAHIIETITFEVLKWDTDLVEFVHRLIVLAGFILVTIGFKKLSKASGSK